MTYNKKFIKSIFFFLILYSSLPAQNNPPIKNWQNMDLIKDRVFGISTDKALELLNSKRQNSIVVAVIDGGVDIDHSGLKANIWTNVKEIPGNGIDDDKNGYIDDIHGWNFLGTGDYTFHYDNKELVRRYRVAAKKDSNSLDARNLLSDIGNKLAALKAEFIPIKQEYDALKHIIKKIGKPKPTIEDFKQFKYKNAVEEIAIIHAVHELKTDSDYIESFREKYESYNVQIEYYFNINYNPRSTHKEFNYKIYGNNDVKGLEPSHGTHVAGIIPTVFKNCKIMVLRTIPDGDPLDEEMALSIRYAVDNGAKIINLSTGKPWSSNKNVVDEAVEYAMKKNVLVVHASGNAGIELTPQSVFPNRNYMKGGEANAWLEVGASGPDNDSSLVPWFSNYGKTTVDVFAPGVDIYSTFPNEKYKYLSGTSMAAPVVSGLAALIFSYYSEITASQVKERIMKSVSHVDHRVKIFRTGEELKFNDICISGGIVNAFNVVMALQDK